MTLTLPTRQDLVNIAKAMILTLQLQSGSTKIDPGLIDRAGTDLNLVTYAGVGLSEETIRQIKSLMAIMYVDSATGSDLDKLAFDRYGLTRPQNSNATVQVTFSRPTTAGGGGVISAGTVLAHTSGLTFTTIYDTVFGAGDLSQTNYAVCSQPGTIGNIYPNTLTVISSAIFDTTITVNNPYNGAGGQFTATDDQYRAIIRNFYATQQRGTLAALIEGAMTVPGVANVSAYDNLDASGIANGSASVIISDLSGNSNNYMVTQVTLALNSWRAAGIPITVIGAQLINQAISIHIEYQAGIDTINAQNSVRSAILNAVNGLAPGQTLLVASILAAANSVAGVIVYKDAVLVPTGDVVPSQGQIIRTSAGFISFV